MSLFWALSTKIPHSLSLLYFFFTCQKKIFFITLEKKQVHRAQALNCAILITRGLVNNWKSFPIRTPEQVYKIWSLFILCVSFILLPVWAFNGLPTKLFPTITFHSKKGIARKVNESYFSFFTSNILTIHIWLFVSCCHRSKLIWRN